jgi:hypothetical protein
MIFSAVFFGSWLGQLAMLAARRRVPAAAHRTSALCVRHVSKYMDTARSQNSPDHGNTLFHSNMLALDDASNFIEHFNCAFIVGDKQSLQNFVEIINPSPPRASLQCRVATERSCNTITAYRRAKSVGGLGLFNVTVYMPSA